MCWDILRQVNEDCKPMLRDVYGAGYLEAENQLPFVVGDIFSAGADAHAVKEAAGVRKPKYFTTALLHQAAQTIQRMIESGKGNVVSRQLEGSGIQICAEDDSDSDDE